MFCLLDPTCWFSFVYMRVKGNRLKKTSYLIKQRELNVIEFVIKLCARLILSRSQLHLAWNTGRKVKKVYKHLQTGNEAWWPRPCLFFAPHTRQRWAMRVNSEDTSTGELSGLFQPDGIDDGQNNPYFTNLHHPVNHLRNPEGERPTSNSTTVQSECRG